MKIILTPQLLEKVRSAAIEGFKNCQHSAIDAHLQPTWFTLQALQSVMHAQGVELQIELPEREFYESIDDL
jgi:hypothetical protein